MTPSRVALPVSTAEHASLAQFMKYLAPVVNEFGDSVPVAPAPRGAPLAEDDRITNPWPVSTYAHSQLMAAQENLGTLLDLMTAKQDSTSIRVTLRSAGPYAIIRAAMESAAQVAWVLTPSSSHQRCIRRLAIRRDELENEQRVLGDFVFGANRVDETPTVAGQDVSTNYASAIDNIKRQQERLYGLIAHAPRELSRSKVDDTQPTWSRIFKNLEASDAKLAEHRILASWKVCAGLSHSKEWARAAALTMKPLANTAEVSSDTVSVGVGVNYQSLTLYGMTTIHLLTHAAGLYRRRTEAGG